MYALTLILALISEGIQPPISVMIRSPRTDHLVGEPVTIEFEVRNDARSAISILDPPFGADEGATRIMLSCEDGGFRVVNCEEACLEPNWIKLEPGDSLKQQTQLLWSRAGGGRLAFDRPGLYIIKVIYPLVLGDKDGNRNGKRDVSSNTVQVRISPPQGADAEVWRLVRAHPLALDYVQHPRDQMPGYDKAMVRLVVDVLAEHPRSRYSAIYEPAVRGFIEREEPVIPVGDRQKFRRFLKMPASPVFPDDARLEANVVVETAEDLARYLHSLERQSGVPLKASPALGKEGWSRARATVVLRNEMATLAEARKGEWKKSGGGYLLVEMKPETPGRIAAVALLTSAAAPVDNKWRDR